MTTNHPTPEELKNTKPEPKIEVKQKLLITAFDSMILFQNFTEQILHQAEPVCFDIEGLNKALTLSTIAIKEIDELLEPKS